MTNIIKKIDKIFDEVYDDLVIVTMYILEILLLCTPIVILGWLISTLLI